MVKALILGGGGFVGRYLAQALRADGSFEPVVTKLPHEATPDMDCPVFDLNLLDGDSAFDLLDTLRPDVIFHLAAQSSVAVSWQQPERTAEINICGTIRLLEAIRRLEKKPRVLMIGSGEEYGAPRTADGRFSEEAALHPGNVYAATKACQGMLGELYAKAYGLELIMIRAFNHIGPRQIPQFVVADFSRQIARIEHGLQPPVIYTGNLSAKRDFTDVRDVVRAYVLLARHGKAGQFYNVASGRAVAVSQILDTLISLANVPITAETDPARLRPVDIPVIEGDITRLCADTGWEAEFSLTQTLTDTLNYWREQTAAESESGKEEPK